MGNCCLPIRFRRTTSAVKPKNVTLLLLGLDNSGKTTILKRLAGEPLDSVVPTVGFSVIILRQKGCHVSIYDLGGGPQFRGIWPRYYADAHGIIFVMDAYDVDKMDECREVLEKLIRSERISGKPILLLANKQDLEGALDEIDIVDRLNLEEVVNEQKCPTLVELCSALNFSKKMDIGIENGYKWLIRTIVRDYQTLNGRVVRDLAKQEEEESKVEVIRRQTDEEMFTRANGCPFKPLKKISGEQGHANGLPVRRKRSGIKTNSSIPGLIDELGEKTDESNFRRHTFLGENPVATISCPSPGHSHSSDFFVLEKFQSDLKLLNDVPNHTLKNFLVRPKSSGARLYGVKTERKRTHRRKPLMKGNKTRPSPFTDISNGLNGQIPSHRTSGGRETGNLPRKNSLENVNPFMVSWEKSEIHEMKTIEGSKSMPNSRRNSRRNSVGVTKKRRHSLINARMEGSNLPSSREILLDVTRISQ